MRPLHSVDKSGDCRLVLGVRDRFTEHVQRGTLHVVAHRGEKRFIALPVKVLAEKWNGDKRRVTGTHPDAGEINTFLSDLEWTAFSVISRLQRAGPIA